jgi:hypothetical protein
MLQALRYKWSVLSGVLSGLAFVARDVEVRLWQHLPITCGPHGVPPPPVTTFYRVLSTLLSLVKLVGPLLALLAAIIGMGKREPAIYTRLALLFALVSFVSTVGFICA